jgi:hypothetical protein
MASTILSSHVMDGVKKTSAACPGIDVEENMRVRISVDGGSLCKAWVWFQLSVMWRS